MGLGQWNEGERKILGYQHTTSLNSTTRGTKC